jgi:hypothetical protein
MKKNLLNRLGDYLAGQGRELKREYRASVGDRERKHPTIPEIPIRRTETDISEAISTQPTQKARPCPHPKELTREIGGVGFRCGACGHQSGTPKQAIGISRAEYESGAYRGTKTNFSPGGFQTAIARMRGAGTKNRS